MYFPLGENLTNETGGFSSSVMGWGGEGFKLKDKSSPTTYRLMFSNTVQMMCPKYDWRKGKEEIKA
jgi:hypothetical protein